MGIGEVGDAFNLHPAEVGFYLVESDILLIHRLHHLVANEAHISATIVGPGEDFFVADVGNRFRFNVQSVGDRGGVGLAQVIHIVRHRQLDGNTITQQRLEISLLSQATEVSIVQVGDIRHFIPYQGGCLETFDS